MCKRSERLLYIDTYSVLAPKSQLERHLFPKTDPSGVHYNKTGKIKVLSKIVATLVKEKAGTVDGENNSQQLSVNTSDISRVGVHTQAGTQCSRYNNTVTELSDRRGISFTFAA